MRLRPLNAGEAAEVELLASRMRDTLVEVLGEARGSGMVDHDWLVERVRFHARVGLVVVAERDGAIVGHAMAREEDGVGHFSTIYVEPASRRAGVAGALVRRVDAWFAERGLPSARYSTDQDNAPLLALFAKHGYAAAETDAASHMVKLTRRLGP